MNALSKKQFFTLALTLFSLFFGAGNFIFPPVVGANSGENFFVGIMFFSLAAVALPVLGVAAVAKAGSLRELANRVDSFTGFIFCTAAYVALGPLLAIPRAGSMPFEIGLVPLLPDDTNKQNMLIIYCIVYFVLNSYACLNQSRLLNLIGKYLTPVLLVLIVLLFLFGLGSAYSHGLGVPKGGYASSAAATGFVDGYQTMDALAALIFASLIADVLKKMGVSKKGELASLSIRAGLFAGVVLFAVYVMLGLLGAMARPSDDLSPAALLSFISTSSFGFGGQVVLGISFLLACFGTTVGLTSAVSAYFKEIFPRISYAGWVYIFSALGAIMASNGLDRILAISVPILVALYPVATTLILLSLIDELIDASALVYKFCVYVAAAIGLASGLRAAGVSLGAMDALLDKLPFYQSMLGWIVPVSVAFGLSYILHIILSKNVRY